MTDNLCPPLPPFTTETATHKLRVAEVACNGRTPDIVTTAYSGNRAKFPRRPRQCPALLTRKWKRQRDHGPIKSLWVHSDTRIAVRFVHEWRDDSRRRYRSHGSENRQFDPDGRMNRRTALINDLPIDRHERLYRWPLCRQSAGHPDLQTLGS